MGLFDKAAQGTQIERKLDEVLKRVNALHRRLDLIEHFSQGSRGTFVGNNRVLVKAVVAERQIAYLVEADDKLLSPWFIVTGGYETELTNFFVAQLKPDSHCLDIGSNFGFFTCLMARFCPDGRVIGVEPDQHVFELVRDNTAINGFNHAEALHAAVCDRPGTVTLYRRNTRSANTSIARAPDAFTSVMGEAPAVPFTVESLRVDDLLPRLGGRVDFVKIDVEGAEPLVFQGARETIATNPQITLVVEWSPGQITGAGFDIGRFLADVEALGLKPFDIAPDGLKPLTFEALAGLPYRAGVVLKRPPRA